MQHELVLRRTEYTASEVFVQELRTELIRKGIHLFIAFVPFFASLNLYVTFVCLGAGTLFYALAELLRFHGRRVPVISLVTECASRRRDIGKIVLGPVTLGLGAMAALFFYPEPAAALAIYALAFGDSFSSIFGKLFGRIKIPFTGGKSVLGSIACFTAVFLITYLVVPEIKGALLIAGGAMVLEALPLRDLDNLIIPVGTGFFAYVIYLL